MPKNIYISLVVAAVLFALALSIRLWEISAPAPQPDEIHWQSRSYEILKRFRSGDAHILTNHIGHPGVPPALIMAAGEQVAETLNGRRKLELGDEGYIDRLSASRIANAIVSSLLVPVVFIGAMLLCGPAVGILAGLLVAFDPHHIALSRMAHLDSLLTLFVVSTFFLYLLAVRKRSVKLKLAAGFFWGLAIATKPTAAVVVIACLVYKAIRNKLQDDETNEPIICWSDIWALIVGHLTLALIFTRLWYHKSHHWRRLDIKSELADVVYNFGIFLTEYKLIVLGLAGFIALAAVTIAYRSEVKEKKRGDIFHFGLFVATVSSLIGLLVIRPAAFENIIRFWYWAAGLAGETHVAYGRQWEAPEGGYLGLLWMRLPLVTIIGVLVSIIFSLSILFLKPKNREKTAPVVIMISALSTAVLWAAFLSFSPKQTIRYLLPVLPLLNLAAAVAFIEIFGIFGSKFKRIVAPAIVVGIALVQGVFTLSWMPDYMVYFNKSSGGISAAIEKNHHLPFVGQNSVVEYLHQCAKTDQHCRRVLVRGDLDTLKYAYRRLFPNEERNVEFIYAKKPSGGYYFFSYYFFDDLVFGDSKPAEEDRVFSYKVHGAPLASVFNLPLDDYQQPYQVSIDDLEQRTGLVVDSSKVLSEAARDGKEFPVIVGNPNPDPTKVKGFLYFGKYLRFPPGTYEFRTTLGLPKVEAFQQGVAEDTPILRLDFLPDCERLVRLNELTQDKLTTVSQRCEVAEVKGGQLRGYWWGRIPIIIKNIEIQRATAEITEDLGPNQ